MRRLVAALLLAFATQAHAALGDPKHPIQNFAQDCFALGGVEADSICPVAGQWCVNYSTFTIYACSFQTQTWKAVGAGGGGGGSVSGPGTVADNATVLWDGPSGGLLKEGPCISDAYGNLTCTPD